MKDCLFCKIIAGDIPAEKIYETEDVLVFLNIYPFERGQLLIIPKQHAENLQQGSTESAIACMRVIHEQADAWMQKLGASGYNLGMNHGADAGQEIFHTHLHWIPRYAGKKREFKKTEPTMEELKVVGDLLR